MLSITLAITGAPAPHVTAENVAAIAVLGIIGTGFAYVLNYQIITSEGATVASTVTLEIGNAPTRFRTGLAAPVLSSRALSSGTNQSLTPPLSQLLLVTKSQ